MPKLSQRIKSFVNPVEPKLSITPEDVLSDVGVESFINNLSEGSQEKLRESLWSRLEFDTPYATSNQERFVGAPGKFTLLRKNLRPI